MGTSRTWMQYNPAILDSILGTTTYNMGCDGRMIKYNHTQMGHLLVY